MKGYQYPSLCWKCANAVPNFEGTRGCSWSTDYKPVEGWQAEESLTVIDIGGKRRTKYYRTSYTVKSCPEFVEG